MFVSNHLIVGLVIFSQRYVMPLQLSNSKEIPNQLLTDDFIHKNLERPHPVLVQSIQHGNIDPVFKSLVGSSRLQ